MSQLRVLINGVSATPIVKGVEQYIINLVKNLCQGSYEVEIHLLIAHWQEAWFENIKSPKLTIHICSPARHVLLRNIQVLREQHRIAAAVRPDIIHVPNTKPIISKSTKTIVTIHDLAEFYVPEKYNQVHAAIRRTFSYSAARNADHIITVSQFSRKTIVDKLRVPAERVTAIWQGVDTSRYYLSESTNIFEKYNLPEKYFLYVGELQRTKNVESIIKAFANLPSQLKKQYSIVLVGRHGNASTDISRLIRDLDIQEQVIHPGYVSEEDLPTIYRSAHALVFVSKYEGFGLPIVEAMASGTAVIASNTTSVGEIAAEGAILVDPENIPAITSALEQLASNLDLRESLIQAGQRHVEQFNWKSTTEKTLQVYQQVAADSERISLFGIPIRNVTMNDLIASIDCAILEQTPETFLAINPDCVNIAHRDASYYYHLLLADHVYADGVGILLAGKWLGTPFKERVPTTDLLPALGATGRPYRIFFLGGEPGAAEKAANTITSKYPNLQIVGTHHGFFQDSNQVISMINQIAPDILFIGMGCPTQERWLFEHKNKLNTPALITCGGMFDYYSGKNPRAPITMQNLGLEWLFRLVIEPKRLWKRYIIGIPVFFLRLLRHRSNEIHNLNDIHTHP